MRLSKIIFLYRGVIFCIVGQILNSVARRCKIFLSGGGKFRTFFNRGQFFMGEVNFQPFLYQESTCWPFLYIRGCLKMPFCCIWGLKMPFLYGSLSNTILLYIEVTKNIYIMMLLIGGRLAGTPDLVNVQPGNVILGPKLAGKWELRPNLAIKWDQGQKNSRETGLGAKLSRDPGWRTPLPPSLIEIVQASH